MALIAKGAEANNETQLTHTMARIVKTMKQIPDQHTTSGDIPIPPEPTMPTRTTKNTNSIYNPIKTRLSTNSSIGTMDNSWLSTKFDRSYGNFQRTHQTIRWRWKAHQLNLSHGERINHEFMNRNLSNGERHQHAT